MRRLGWLVAVLAVSGCLWWFVPSSSAGASPVSLPRSSSVSLTVSPLGSQAETEDPCPTDWRDMRELEAPWQPVEPSPSCGVSADGLLLDARLAQLVGVLLLVGGLLVLLTAASVARSWLG